MAKKNIHPNYHDVTVVLTDGTEFKTKSACKDNVIKLDVDPLNHPAWQAAGTRFVNVKDDQVSKFNKKFGGFDFGFSGEKEEKKPEKKKVEKKKEVESPKEEKPKEKKEEDK